MIEIAHSQGLHALKAAISNLLNALDREDISDDDRNQLQQTSIGLFAAAQWWGDNVLSVKFDAYDKAGERIPEDDPVSGRIYGPLRKRMWYTLERLEWTRMFWEGVLLVKQRGAGGRVSELSWLNPNMWEPDITTWEGLRGFRVRRRGLRFRNEADLGYVKRRDAIYINGIDFEDDYGGVAPAEVAYLNAGLEVEIAQTWLAIFRNRMMPFGVVQPAQGSSAWDDKTRNIITSALRVITGGSRNAGKTIVSPGRAEWIQLGQKLDGIPVSEFDNRVNDAIEAATGVYRSLISPGESSYSEAEVARRTWGHAKFVPHLNKLGFIFTEDLAMEYLEVAEIKPRLDEIPFLKEDEASKSNYVNQRVQGVTMDLYNAQVELKDDEPDEALKGFYLIQGTPVHRDKIPLLADRLIAPEPALPEAGGGFGGGGADDPPAQLDDQPVLLPGSIPRPERRYVPDDQYRELKNWQRVSERKKAKPFQPEALLGATVADFIEEALSSDHAVPDIFAVASDALKSGLTVDQAWEALEAMKSQNNYRRGIRAAVRGLWAGATSLTDFEDSMASVIRRYFVEAWRRGIKAAGAEESDLTARDTERLQVEIAQEILYAMQFGADIEASSKANGGKLAPLYGRIEAWVDTYERIEFLAMSIAGRGVKYKWVRDPAKDSCDDCIRLDGRVYFGRVFERENVYPRCRKLNCTGLKCGCRLERTDEPVTRGRFPTLLGPKSHIHITTDVLATKGQGKPGLTVVARLANDPVLIDLWNLVYDASDAGMDGQWCNPDDFHITLVSANLVTDEQAEAITARLPESVAPFEIKTGALVRFGPDNNAYGVWVLEIDAPSLVEYQKLIYEAFRAEGVEVSGYSEPDAYKPHVTLAYVADGVEMPEVVLPQDVATFVQEIHFTRSSYEPVHIIGGATV